MSVGKQLDPVVGALPYGILQRNASLLQRGRFSTMLVHEILVPNL